VTYVFLDKLKSSTLDDLESQYCDRNCIRCSASSAVTAGLSCSAHIVLFTHGCSLWEWRSVISRVRDCWEIPDVSSFTKDPSRCCVSRSLVQISYFTSVTTFSDCHIYYRFLYVAIVYAWRSRPRKWETMIPAFPIQKIKRVSIKRFTACKLSLF